MPNSILPTTSATTSPLSPQSTSAPTPLEQEARAYKPSLPRVELTLIALNNSTKKMGEKLNTITLSALERENNAIDLWTQEQVAALAKQAQEKKSWSHLSFISSSIISLCTAFSGLLLMRSGIGADAGRYLVGSGTLGLVNAFGEKYQLWDWVTDLLAADNEDRRRQLKMSLPMAFTLVSMGLSLRGAAVLPANYAPADIQRWIDMVKDYTKQGTDVGQAYVSYRQGQAEAHIVEIQGNLARYTGNAESTAGSLEFQVSQLRTLSATLKQAIQKTIHETSATARQI